MELPLEWVGAFLALTALELVLGIDNIVFITILASRVERRLQQRTRLVGLSLALVMRVALLFSISWLMGLSSTLFTVMGNEFSGSDLILGAGGLFLVWKAVHEIGMSLEPRESTESTKPASAALMMTLVQIALVDVVFSFDSVIVAVGLVDQLPVMVAAIVVAVLVMMISSEPIANFVESNPSVRLLALSFLVLIGSTLVMEGLGFHVPKGYIYFAMAFSLAVQLLDMWIGKRGQMTLNRPRFRRVVP